MIIDIEKIKKLLSSDLTGYRASQLVDISQQQYDKYRKGQAPIDVMSIKTAEQLMKIIKMEESKMMTKEKIMKMMDEGKQLEFNSYGDEKDIAELVLDNIGERPEVKQVEYLGPYDGPDFEYNEKQIFEDDQVYLIKSR